MLHCAGTYDRYSDGLAHQAIDNVFESPTSFHVTVAVPVPRA